MPSRRETAGMGSGMFRGKFRVYQNSSIEAGDKRLPGLGEDPRGRKGSELTMPAMNEQRSLLPCATCPWRVEKDAETIPNYSQEKALALRDTVGEGDALRRVMACHHSLEDAPISCRGYLAQVGWTNIWVRILVAKGRLPTLERIRKACRGIRLHRNYGEMMDKLTLSYERRGRGDAIRRQV